MQTCAGDPVAYNLLIEIAWKLALVLGSRPQWRIG